MVRVLIFLVIGLLSVTLQVQAAAAEFLRTAEAVYQSTDKRVKIIISYDKLYSGIFISSGPEIDLQVFHPSKIPATESLHCFIRYNAGLGTYDKLFLGPKSFLIKGVATINLGFLRLTVDPEQPYLTIVYDNALGNKRPPEILGFSGLNVIVNNTGNIAAALLEANQFSKYRGLIDPYFIKFSENELRLFVKGDEVQLASIGLALESPKVCSRKGTVLLPRDDVERIKAIPNPRQREQELSRLLQDTKREGLFSDLVYLRSDEKAEIAYDAANGGRIYILKPASQKGKVQTCTVEELDFG